MSTGCTFADALNSIQVVFPTYGDSFYAKGKLFRREPPPNPSSVILNLIRQCSLGCRFCLAADTQRPGDYDSAKAIERLVPELHGIGRITLVGGEPTEHPEFHAILRSLWSCVTQEIEVFTNGTRLPEQLDAAQEWLAPALVGRGNRVLRLTLAVDVHHRERLGPHRLDRLTEVLVELEQQGTIRAMFNITDYRIHSNGYLDLPTVRQLLNELCPTLVSRFMTLVEKRSVESSFYLNPVVVLGRQRATAGTEMLRPVDFLFHPETVMVGRSDGFRAMSALAATWMTSPPEQLVLARDVSAVPGLDVGMEMARRLLANRHYPWIVSAFESMVTTRRESNPGPLDWNLKATQRKGVSAMAAETIVDHLRLGQVKEVATWIAALKIHSSFLAFLEDSEDWFRTLADELLDVTPLGDGAPPCELTGRADFDKVGLPVVRRILSRLASGRHGDFDLFGEPAALWKTLVAGGGHLLPVLATRTQSLGGIASRDLEVVPLTQTSLDTAFGLWPDPNAEFAVRVRVATRDGRAGDIWLSEVEVRPLSLPEERALEEVRRLLSYWDAVYGAQGESLRRTLITEEDSCWTRSLNRLLGEGAGADDSRVGESGHPLATIFEYVSFEPSRQRAPWDNPMLLDLLEHHTDYSGRGTDDINDFLGRVAFWRDYYAPSESTERMRP
jgi:hypothetical protein